MLIFRKSVETGTPDRVRRSRVRGNQVSEIDSASRIRMTHTSRTMEPTLVPGIELGTRVMNRPWMRAARLQRGQPNSTSVGLVKPWASPGTDSDCEQGGRSRIKVSFMGRNKPSVRREGSGTRNTRSLENGSTRLVRKDSLTNLKNISEVISEMKTGVRDWSYGCPVANRDMFEGRECKEEFDCPVVFEERKEENNAMNELNSITYNPSPRSPSLVAPVCITRTSQISLENSYSQCSPVTRSQMKRKSHSFQFALPAEMKSPVIRDN